MENYTVENIKLELLECDEVIVTLKNSQKEMRGLRSDDIWTFADIEDNITIFSENGFALCLAILFSLTNAVKAISFKCDWGTSVYNI